jgi:DNA-binding transcriptional LysR family regulator
MDRLDAMALFVQIAERGSLTRAAAALHTSLPSVVRTLAALEARLGVRLFNRTTRRLALTAEGQQYLVHCRRILADVADAESALGMQQQVPAGDLSVTAPLLFGQLHVTPVIGGFLERHRQVRVALTLSDQPLNLVQDGFDIAVRIGHLPDSGLVAKPVGQIRRVVCASPKYLKQAGTPARPQDLAGLECVRLTGLTPGNTWQFAERGRPVTVPVKGPFVCNQALATIDACLQGLGFGMFLSYQVQHLLARKRLRTVLEPFEPPPIPVSIVYPQARYLATRARLLIDWMSEHLRQRLARSV